MRLIPEEGDTIVVRTDGGHAVPATLETVVETVDPNVYRCRCALMWFNNTERKVLNVVIEPPPTSGTIYRATDHVPNR